MTQLNVSMVDQLQPRSQALRRIPPIFSDVAASRHGFANDSRKLCLIYTDSDVSGFWHNAHRFFTVKKRKLVSVILLHFICLPLSLSIHEQCRLVRRSGTLSRTVFAIQLLYRQLQALVENVFVFNVPVQLAH